MKRKTEKILTILMLAIIILGVNVYAATNTFKASVTPGTATLKPGEEITVSVDVSDINMGENGINALEGTIKYDSNIFESVTSSNVQSFNNWSTTYNDETSSLNGKFLAVNLTAGVKENMKILSVKFKVKSDIKETTTTQIDFKDLTSNDGEDLVNVGTKSVKITVNVEKQQEPETPVKPITPPTTEAPGTLPQTGESIVITLAIIAIVLAGISIAVRYKKMKDIR